MSFKPIKGKWNGCGKAVCGKNICTCKYEFVRVVCGNFGKCYRINDEHKRIFHSKNIPKECPPNCENNDILHLIEFHPEFFHPSHEEICNGKCGYEYHDSGYGGNVGPSCGR